MTGKIKTMPSGALSMMADRPGRVEIADPDVFDLLGLNLSDSVVQQIRKLEESILTAEQRLGTFRVG